MKKNIIILHTDQQRFDSLGCNGNEHAQTTNIDQLASEGCNFLVIYQPTQRVCPQEQV
ncbi:hypothetical protein JCM19233_6516 [Vibrio astriarenae]|nr:hypothetical protein JCM19233_6516 [Vibrio sp. C7]